MKAQIRDVDALRALKPLEVSAYLRAKGWRQASDLRGKASLWLLAREGDEFDVTVPQRREMGDYALRISEVLETLAKVEQRSELDVLRDLLTVTADLIRVRAPSQDAENGTLPLDRAVEFVERSRDMMLAAACATLDKRAFFAKRKAQQAMDYLSHVRMGQTEHGSYVLTILSPVAPELKPVQEMLPIIAEVSAPYERQVTQTLIESLRTLDDAARTAGVLGDMAPFQDAISKGVSANLCDAVVGLSDVSSGRGLEIQVSWSRSRPVDEGMPTRVFLASDTMPIIQEAARQFREAGPFEDVEVEGVVTRLDRGPDAVEGEVTIYGNIEGQFRRMTLKLEGEKYSKAVQAHDLRQTVKCAGDLVKEGRGYRLQNPRRFEVLSGDEPL